MQTHLGRAHRDSERFGDLVMGPSLQIFQNHDPSLVLMEHRQRFPEDRSQAQILGGQRRVPFPPQVDDFGQTLECGGRLAGSARSMRQRRVDGDAVEPGADGGLTSKTRQGSPGSNERLLRHVIGEGVISTDQPHGQREHLMLVELDQPGECRGIAPLGALDEDSGCPDV